jgi:hypothetical protein
MASARQAIPREDYSQSALLRPKLRAFSETARFTLSFAPSGKSAEISMLECPSLFSLQSRADPAREQAATKTPGTASQQPLGRVTRSPR